MVFRPFYNISRDTLTTFPVETVPFAPLTSRSTTTTAPREQSVSAMRSIFHDLKHSMQGRMKKKRSRQLLDRIGGHFTVHKSTSVRSKKHHPQDNSMVVIAPERSGVGMSPEDMRAVEREWRMSAWMLKGDARECILRAECIAVIDPVIGCHRQSWPWCSSDAP